jgi:hypothetical protein
MPLLFMLWGYQSCVVMAFPMSCHKIQDRRIFVSPSNTKKLDGSPPQFSTNLKAISSSGLWNVGAEFGKGPFRFFRSFEEWMKPFPDEDRLAYPELFQLSTGVTEVSLPKPLGLLLEEVEPGRGVKVEGFVPDGNAERLAADRIQIGDVLVGITAVKIVGARWERRMIPCRNFDYDAVVGAIRSNDRKWGCEDVVLWLERPGVADPDKVNAMLEFFEPPFETPWKQRQ